MTAFATALLESIGGTPQSFTMTHSDGEAADCSCETYLKCSSTEASFFERNLSPDSHVLDFGCGIGRHVHEVLRLQPSSICSGIEIDEDLRDYCESQFPSPHSFYNTLYDLPDEPRFDLILLLGNGIGIFGTEESTVQQLSELLKNLSPSGSILIDVFHSDTEGFRSQEFQISYKGQEDPPFVWGNASLQWIENLLRDLGCQLTFYSQEKGTLVHARLAAQDHDYA